MPKLVKCLKLKQTGLQWRLGLRHLFRQSWYGFDPQPTDDRRNQPRNRSTQDSTVDILGILDHFRQFRHFHATKYGRANDSFSRRSQGYFGEVGDLAHRTWFSELK